jgi:hypothetical protein
VPVALPRPWTLASAAERPRHSVHAGVARL